MKNKTDLSESNGRLAFEPVLCAVPSRKKQILEYLKKKTPDYTFDWHGEKWVCKYETVKSLKRETGIPKSSIYSALKQLQGLKGFSFSHRLISYEYPK